MPMSRSHGKAYVEPERHDELCDGVAGPAHVDASAERTAGGKLAKGARTVPSLGGKAHKGTTRLSHRIDAGGTLGKHAKRARYFRRAACHELATTVGGGHCGILASTLVKLAAEAMALAEAALEAGDVEKHRRLGETARMHIVYAREIAAKDAESRAETGVVHDPLARFVDVAPERDGSPPEGSP